MPAYQMKAWQEEGWWLARVTGASDGADPAPLNALTQARSLGRIEAMGRDLIATVLDADETSFDVEMEYVLPGDAGALVCQARGARAWLEAAQELWHERSAVAARALAGRGYSLREAAALLGLSYQRVDQLLDSQPRHTQLDAVVLECASGPAGGPQQARPDDVDALVVLRRHAASQGGGLAGPPASELEARFGERIRALLADMASHYAQAPDSGRHAPA